jgi:hypothetical protein
VQRDPSGYLSNPYLYDNLQRIYLRLCDQNVPEHAVEPRDMSKIMPKSTERVTGDLPLGDPE